MRERIYIMIGKHRHDGFGDSDSRQRGFSISEMLVVIAFIAITVAIGIPLVSEQMRIAQIRAAADQFAGHLRAARLIAVAKRAKVTVTVNNENAGTTANSISYPIAFDYSTTPNPTATKTTSMTMPPTVKIKSTSTANVQFNTDGSASAAATFTTESVVSTSTERWTLSVNTMGLVTVAHVRV